MIQGLIIPILQTFENNGIRKTCNTLYPQDILYGLSTISSWPSGANQHLSIDEPAEYDVIDHVKSYEQPSSAISSLTINMGTCQVHPNQGTLTVVDGSTPTLNSGYYFTSYEVRDLHSNELYCSGKLSNQSYNNYTHSDGGFYTYNERRTAVNCMEIAGKEIKLILNRLTSPYNSFLYNSNQYRLAAVNLEFCGSSIYTCGSGGFTLLPTEVINSDFYRENSSFSNLHLSVNENIESSNDSKYISYFYDVGTSGLSTINLYCENELFEHTPFFSLLKIRVKDGPTNYELSASWENGIDLIGESETVNVVGGSGYQDIVLHLPVTYLDNEDVNLDLGNNVNIQFHGTGIKSNPLVISTINQEIIYNKCTAEDVNYSTLFITNNDFCNKDISPTGDLYNYPDLFINELNSTLNKYASVDEDFVENLGYNSNTDDDLVKNALDYGLVPATQNYGERLDFLAEGLQNVPFEAAFQIRQSANYDVDISNIRWYDNNDLLIASGENQTIEGISNFLGYQYPMSIQSGSFDLSSTKIYSQYARNQPLDYIYGETGFFENYQTYLSGYDEFGVPVYGNDFDYPFYSFKRFNINNNKYAGSITYFYSTGLLNHFNDLYDYYFSVNYNSIQPTSVNSSYVSLWSTTPSGDVIFASGYYNGLFDYFSPDNPIRYNLIKDQTKSSCINSLIAPLYLTYTIDKGFSETDFFIDINHSPALDTPNPMLVASGNSFLREPFKISSISINADYECTGVEESGYIPLYVSGSASPEAFIDLFLLNTISSKEVDLYLHNFETADSGVDLFIRSTVFDSLNLFIKSDEPLRYIDGVNLFLLGRPSGQINDNITLHTRSFPESSGGLNLYLDVSSTGNTRADIPLYLDVKEGFTSSGTDLYLYGFDTIQDTCSLYLDAIQNTGEALNLYLYSNTPGHRSGLVSMFMHGYDLIDSGIELFLAGTGVGSVDDNLPIFIKWDGEIDKNLLLYTKGSIFDGFKSTTLNITGYNEPVEISQSFSLNIQGLGIESVNNHASLYLHNFQVEDNSIELYIAGNTSTEYLDLYLENLDFVSSLDNSINISLFADSGVDTLISQVELFVRSDSVSDNMNLYIESDESAQNSGYMNLFIEGLTTNNNTELVVWNEFSGLESRVDLTLQAIEEYSHSGEFNLFIERDSESLVAYTPMFLLVNDSINKNMTMYIDGTYISDNNITLFMPSSIDTYLGNVNSYIHGY